LGGASSTRNAMPTHKTTPLPKSFTGLLYNGQQPLPRGITTQGPRKGKALFQKIEDAQLHTTYGLTCFREEHRLEEDLAFGTQQSLETDKLEML